ncbi:MAG: outer membrane protein assembly factor BamA [Phycisphaeraceae bacterium]
MQPSAQSRAAQVVEFANRPIAEVRITGLKDVKELLVRNQIRSVKGTPYDPKAVEADIVRITHLGRFASVQVKVTPKDDNTVILTFDLSEQLVLADVRVVGNKRFTDQEILGYLGTTGWMPGKVLLRAGDGVDPPVQDEQTKKLIVRDHLINQSADRIKRAYEDAGYFQVDVTFDADALRERNLLTFQIREGPLASIHSIKFEGNKVFSDGELNSEIKSETYLLIFRKGHLSREVIDGDVARLRTYYRNHGYLECEVGRRVDISPDEKDAIVTFLINEGPLYTVGSIRVGKWEMDKDGRPVLTDSKLLFPQAQILENLGLKVGDVYSSNRERRSREAVRDLYGKLGHIEMRLRKRDGTEGLDRIYFEREPKVEVVVGISEGKQHFAGNIDVRGNTLTKDDVILREIRGMEPGRPFDRSGIDFTERRLRESPYFDQASITLLGSPDDDIRDVLIEVKEVDRPGTISFGAAVSSDTGLIGAVDLVQKNFDISDWPDDASEMFTGQAFRGAGQYFSITLQPGAEYNNFAIRFREPYLFETPLFLDARLRYFNRQREDFDEGRAGGFLSVGKYFGDIWRAQVDFRYELINIGSVDLFAPVDVAAVAGGSAISGLGFSITRDTTNSRIFPTQGNTLNIGIERVGAVGGDFNFTRLGVEFHQYWKVDEDFFGRPTVLALRAQAGYIIENNEAPIFERHFAGGHRSFRGFDFRGVGPRGIISNITPPRTGDDPVGGDWLFLLGLEYNFPVYEELLRGVVFIDTGTVQKDFGLNEYRVSIGMGIRVKIPFLGNAPLAFDIAFPLLKQEGDEIRFFSFDLALPFYAAGGGWGWSPRSPGPMNLVPPAARASPSLNPSPRLLGPDLGEFANPQADSE